MNKTHLILPAIFLSLATTSAMAAPAKGQPPADVSAIMKASPSLNATPGAAAAANAKAAQEGVTTQATASERFSGTGANLHGEDQCTIFNLNISRYVPPQGSPTTYLNYDARNLCSPGLSASGSSELPDAVFTGDPRKSNKVALKVDLSAGVVQVLGPPLIADITFTKTPAVINRSNYRTVNETNADGVKKVLTFNTTSVNTTANVTGTLSLGTSPLPLDSQSANINWDDTINTTSVQ